MTWTEFCDRMNRLRKRTSVVGWKGPHSLAVDDSTWDAAIEIVESLWAYNQKGPPFISADSSGSLYLSYEHICIEVAP